MCDISRLSDAPLCDSTSGSQGPPMLYAMKSTASSAIGQPTARRVASSSSTTPVTATTMSHRRWLSRAQRELAVEEQQIGRGEGSGQRERPVEERHAIARRRLECRPRGEREEQREGKVQRERASVSFRIPKPKVNGSGEAYQSWKSAHASATVKISFAVRPTGLRAPVSALATSSCSASGAFSISVAMLAPSYGQTRGAKSPSPLACFRVRAASRSLPDPHLIQPFSL